MLNMKKVVFALTACALSVSAVAFAAKYDEDLSDRPIMQKENSKVTVTSETSRGNIGDRDMYLERINTYGRTVLYVCSKDSWKWQGEKPQLAFAALHNGTNVPDVPKAANVKPLPTAKDMAERAKKLYATAEYADSIVLYATTGPAPAFSRIAITRVEMYGRLLNATVAIDNTVPEGAVRTKELTYPECVISLNSGELPKVGNMRVRFIDRQGNALAVQDVSIGK